LIQGDVGCGKTVIALLASQVAIWNGYQAVFMAPTEILAEQHFRTVKELTTESGIIPVLLTSGQPKSQRDKTLALIQQGNANLVIGTHSLIQETVVFHRLGLTVIDEQHKFGVLQRAKLLKKGDYPDLLVLTATPIPRTLGLTVYGDLDISVINELPPGRPSVRTLVFHEGQRTMVYSLVEQELQKGNQAFIVYPLIDESENLELRNATRMASHLQQDVFVQYKVGLLHGRMTSVEKEAIMQSFQSGRIHILVATTVIEVGLDIPSASVMVIEHAERFGLSQLHQLRGRIGRGSSASLCILLAQYRKSDDAEQRLRIMARTNNGFEIAEEDFQIRGPGEFLGTRQSGMPDFRVAHIGRDVSILAEAREAALRLIRSDPQLLKPEHRYLRKMLLFRWKERLELAGIG
jgi:ATP-dependent DNA helicase RecG